MVSSQYAIRAFYPFMRLSVSTDECCSLVSETPPWMRVPSTPSSPRLAFPSNPVVFLPKPIRVDVGPRVLVPSPAVTVTPRLQARPPRDADVPHDHRVRCDWLNASACAQVLARAAHHERRHEVRGVASQPHGYPRPTPCCNVRVCKGHRVGPRDADESEHGPRRVLEVRLLSPCFRWRAS